MKKEIEKLEKIINKSLGKKLKMSPSDSLKDQGISSAYFMLILSQIETEYKVDIPTHELNFESFYSLESIAQMLERIKKL